MKGKKMKRIVSILVMMALCMNMSAVVMAEKEDTELNALQAAGLDLYNDVSAGAWYYNDINQITVPGVMKGYANDYFGPADLLNRSQFATILYRLEGSPSVAYESIFSDVPNNQFYSQAVTWAAKNGLVTGYTGSKEFGSNDSITREQLVTMMYRYASYKGYDVSVDSDYSNFPDANLVSQFAEKSMKWAVDREVITGKNGRLESWNTASRAECAAIMNRFSGLYGMKTNYVCQPRDGVYGYYNLYDVPNEPWVEYAGSYLVKAESAGKNRVNLAVEFLGINYSPIYETETIYNIPIIGNKAIFEWEDSWGNKGVGRVTFEDGALTITMRITEMSSSNRGTLECESWNLPYIGIEG